MNRTQPTWDSPWNRVLAALELLAQPILFPVAAILYGVADLRGQTRHVRFLLKTIRTGKTGPYPGVTW